MVRVCTPSLILCLSLAGASCSPEVEAGLVRKPSAPEEQKADSSGEQADPAREKGAFKQAQAARGVDAAPLSATEMRRRMAIAATSSSGDSNLSKSMASVVVQAAEAMMQQLRLNSVSRYVEAADFVRLMSRLTEMRDAALAVYSGRRSVSTSDMGMSARAISTAAAALAACTLAPPEAADALDQVAEWASSMYGFWQTAGV